MQKLTVLVLSSTIIALFLLSSLSGIVWSDTPIPTHRQYHPGSFVVLPDRLVTEGALTRVDPTLQTVWVRTRFGVDNQMKFRYDERTQIVGADAMVGCFDPSIDTFVRISYKTSGGIHIALEIEVIQR